MQLIDGAEWIGLPSIVIGELWVGFLAGTRVARDEAELDEFSPRELLDAGSGKPHHPSADHRYDARRWEAAMTPEQDERREQLFEQALELPEADRAAFLEETCLERIRNTAMPDDGYKRKILARGEADPSNERRVEQSVTRLSPLAEMPLDRCRDHEDARVIAERHLQIPARRLCRAAC